MKAQGLNITGTGPTHAAVLELVLGNRRVRLTVDAEAIEAGAAAADDAMFISRILERTRGLDIWMRAGVAGKPPITSIIKAIEVGDAACTALDRQAAGFKATAARSFKLYALHDLGPVKAGQPVLVVHSDRGMVDCIPWPESMLRIPANELTELIVNEVDGPLLGETIRPTCGECQGAGVTAEETTSPEGAPAIVEDTCGRCGGEGVEPAPLGFKVPTVDEAALASARWLGDTLVTPEVDPADLEGRRARVEPIPTDLKVRVALDRLFTALARARVLDGQEHDGCSDDELIDRVTALVPALAALRRDKHDEVYEVAGQEFALPSDVVAELKGAAPLLLEQADAELLAALRAAAGAFARVRELEAGITDALDHLGSAREEDSLDRREQYRAEAERALQGVL